MAVKFLDGITVNSGSSSAATIIAEGTRPVTITGGAIGSVAIKGSSGGWASGYFFTGYSGTFRGGFGALGNGNNLSYYFIGDAYNDTTMVVQPNAGNVGIGTTSPGYKLDIDGDVRGNSFWFRTNTASAPASTGGFYRPSLGDVAYGYNASELFRILSSGNVGIGTTAPKDKLHVEGHLRVASTSPIIKLDETDRANENWAIINSGGVMTFRTSNSAFSSYNTKISINQTGSIEFNSYTASATAAGITAVNPNQNFYPSGTGSDTTTDLAVDQSGNVVRTTQEATWKLTRAQVNAITTSTNGNTLLSAPGSSNLFIIIEKVTFLIQFAYNGNQMAANQQYEILQDGNVADQIAILNGNRVNDIAYRGGSANTSGIYEHDTGYATLNRTYKPNTATTIRRANTGALNTAVISMSIKMRYRVYDTATF